MKFRALHTSLLSLWLAVYLFAGVELPQGFVMCLGVDGHLAVEATGEGGRCGAELSVQGIADALINTNADHCGPCLDLTVVLSTIAPGPSSPRHLVLSSQAALPVHPVPAVVRLGFQSGFLPHFPSNTSFLLSLRSTVLLI